MTFGFKNLTIDIYGESHSEKIGVVIRGIPIGETLTLAPAYSLISRRRAGKMPWDTPRKEDDSPLILRGLKQIDDGDKFGAQGGESSLKKGINCNTGAKNCDKSRNISNDRYVVTGDIEACFLNNNVRKADYNVTVPRPSHADYAAFAKDGVIKSGGGRFSGRMTLPLCFAGGIAVEILQNRGISVAAYLAEVGGIKFKSYLDDVSLSLHGIDACLKDKIYSRALPVLDDTNLQAATDKLRLARQSGDSLGGVAECIITGVPAGLLGDALFDGLEGKISSAVFAVPAVKGIEFGRGFGLCGMRGSAANDPFEFDGDKVITSTNNSGGINGGISNGMPILFRAAIKPTPSISKPQRSIDLATGKDVELKIDGRHDVCVAARVAPCIEAAAALAVLDEVYQAEN